MSSFLQLLILALRVELTVFNLLLQTAPFTILILTGKLSRTNSSSDDA